MKHILLVLAAILLSSPAFAGKRGVAIIGMGDHHSSVAAVDEADRTDFELPADTQYGFYRDTFTVFWVPVASWSGRTALVSESDNSVWELEGEDLKYFEEKYGSAAGAGGWAKYCNFVTGAIVALLIYLKFKGGSGGE